MKYRKRSVPCLVTAILGFVIFNTALAEPRTYEWETKSGLLFSASEAAINAVTGQVSVPIPTPVGVRYFVEGSINGTFTYDADAAVPFEIRGTSQVYLGASQAWTAQLISGGSTIGTFTGDIGETIIRDGDAVPANVPDLVNVNMCGAPWCTGVNAFTVGDWQATNSSLVWIGDGFQDGDAPPMVLPPPGAPPALALFTFFNPLTGENTSILSREIEIREAAEEVAIDVKPGSDPNCFNINGHGVIPVAVLGSEAFDVGNVDQTSLSFGGLSVRVRGNKFPQCSGEYSNADEHLDLVCHFADDSNAWVEGSDTATLSGMLLDGTRFEGTDSICLVP